MRQQCCGGREYAVFAAEQPITVLGYDEPVAAIEVAEQDFIQVPAQGVTWIDRWLVVEGIHLNDDHSEAHLLLRVADEAEVSWERYEAARDRLSRAEEGRD